MQGPHCGRYVGRDKMLSIVKEDVNDEDIICKSILLSPRPGQRMASQSQEYV